ncbi:hypothetical protein QJS10_CPB20g01269 [Acorus calamus]|uniref:Uncharacterized protein n=1 Tax=Acorus calamus TaxID=4465 RepID=A0AAV9CA55_ACOCL|nr:hypothetical protein QJS10_CPB20g01269 [Acorus calamus]
MLDKVPEANWVCEGCILKEESEKQKLDKFETKLGRESSFERKQNFGGTLNSGILSKSCNQPIDVEVMPNSKGLKGLKIPCKRSADSTEVSSVSKQRAPDMSNVSPRATSTSKKPSLSRESSFKSVDIGKVKPINLAQLPGNRVSNNPQAVPPSPSSSLNSSRMRPQSSRGRFTNLSLA